MMIALGHTKASDMLMQDGTTVHVGKKFVQMKQVERAKLQFIVEIRTARN